MARSCWGRIVQTKFLRGFWKPRGVTRGAVSDVMHLSFLFPTLGGAGNPGEFDTKSRHKGAHINTKQQPGGEAIWPCAYVHTA